MKAPVRPTAALRFSNNVETALAYKVQEHNKLAPKGQHATLNQLRRVYRRGAGAFTPSVTSSVTRDQHAMARVNAYLHLLKHGKPANPRYTQDYDVLPVGHPKCAKFNGIITASVTDDTDDDVIVSLEDESFYSNPEHALFSMAEFSGLGYEIIPALRAAWLRGTQGVEKPFDRALELATKLYDSKDADLLPVAVKG